MVGRQKICREGLDLYDALIGHVFDPTAVDNNIDYSEVTVATATNRVTYRFKHLDKCESPPVNPILASNFNGSASL